MEGERGRGGEGGSERGQGAMEGEKEGRNERKERGGRGRNDGERKRGRENDRGREGRGGGEILTSSPAHFSPSICCPTFSHLLDVARCLLLRHDATTNSSSSGPGFTRWDFSFRGTLLNRLLL